MPIPPDLIIRAYDAFNRRDIDAALATMHADVEWPNGMEGGFVHGHDAVRAYWTRQWTTIDPHVEPVDFVTDDQGRLVVTVHQVVRDLAGSVLVDQSIEHVYTIEEGLIRRMDIGEVRPERPALLRIYEVFNQRDLDGVLAFIHPDVVWDAGGAIGTFYGHEALRARWTEEWQRMRPQLEPVAWQTDDKGRLVISVHQSIYDLADTLIGERMVEHAFTLEDGLIRRGDLSGL